MMHDCPDGAMRDALPDFVHGTLPAPVRARVAEHVAACEACAAEVALIETARRAFPVAPMNVARIVSALRRPPISSRGLRVHQWRIAAAVSFIAVGLLSAAVLRDRLFARAADAPVPTPASAVRGTEARGTGAPVVAAPRPAVVAPRSVLAETGRVRDGSDAHAGLTIGGSTLLTDDQLQKLLDDLDGMQAVPSAEPEVSRRPIIPIDDEGYW